MKIVIVGGGAGGLELATTLGRRFARSSHEIVLIDRNPMHVWKPLLHEVAAGSLDIGIDSVSYRAHGHRHGFTFKQGALVDVDRSNKLLQLAPMHDDSGDEILPSRNEPYDVLVLAIGSMNNDFGTPGVREYCTFLDSTDNATGFHRSLVNQFIKLNRRLLTEKDARLRIAIVGGGATGVELTAELFNSRDMFSQYGLERVHEDHLEVSIIEAGPRLVPALSERVSAQVLEQLKSLGAKVHLGTQVAEAEPNGFVTKGGEKIAADMMLWAAGVRVAGFISKIEGLEVNRIGQLLVSNTLQTTKDDSIFAIGDCAGFALANDRWVPPRAQSAHQMASCVAKNIELLANGRELKSFVYSDKGTLISLSERSTVGVLMGNLPRGSSINVQGRLARVAYISLYRLHQIALHGWFHASLMMLSDRIAHIIRPRLKLH